MADVGLAAANIGRLLIIMGRYLERWVNSPRLFHSYYITIVCGESIIITSHVIAPRQDGACSRWGVKGHGVDIRARKIIFQ